MTVAVRNYSRAKPYAARKFAVCKDILADLKAERAERFEAAMKVMERDIGRIVRFNVRRETQ